jgi:hypothetical protein
MIARACLLSAVAALTLGCEMPTRPTAFVIPGPSVPDTVPTQTPYVWDTREELSVWINSVTKGSFTLEGSGTEALLRLGRADVEWALRGPDLSPVPADVRTAIIRYRWVPDPSLSPTASRTMVVGAIFETSSTSLQPYYHGQGSASATLEPTEAVTEITFRPSQYTPPIDVRYFYLHSYGGNRGVLEIDRIALVR